jgi:hypothetical protein
MQHAKECSMKMTVQSANASHLTNGRHPAFLIHLDEEPTPVEWQMYAKSPTLWRWYTAVWENPGCIGQVDPEIQSAITSAKFTRPGKFPASNAFLWAQEILQRQIPVGEVIDWETLLPYPCTVKVEHPDGAEYVRISGFEAWPDGHQYLPQLRALLLHHQQVAAQASQSARAVRGMPQANGHEPAPAPAPAPSQTWGSAPGPVLGPSPVSPPVGWAAQPERYPGEEPARDDIPF